MAVICASLDVVDELQDVEIPPSDERSVFVITVHDLKNRYEAAYDAALGSADQLATP